MLKIHIYFNPRSLTGATLTTWKRTCLRTYFNPRSLTGATLRSVIFFFQRRFQSTLPHGSDGNSMPDAFISSVFQSTLPHGSDSKMLPWRTTAKYFNPRSLTGATGHGGQADGAEQISIHAPSRERLKCMLLKNSSKVFQSTLPHGSDCRKLLCL